MVAEALPVWWSSHLLKKYRIKLEHVVKYGREIKDDPTTTICFLVGGFNPSEKY